MKEQFLNMYPVTKNIKFEAIPVGRTEEYFEKNLILDEDEKRADAYELVKSCIDRVHKQHIASVLNHTVLERVDEYAELYFDTEKSDSEKQTMIALEDDLRKQIANKLQKPELFKSLFSVSILNEVLPSYIENDKEKKAVDMFDGFYTYFAGYNKIRRKLYGAEDDSTTVAHRCINDNLPKFLDNVKSFMLIAASLSDEDINELNKTCLKAFNIYAKDAFSVDYFSLVLSQSGIDTYNAIIGGFSTPDGKKIKGVNEYVNLYNQQVAKKERNKRLPLLKELYKQLLTEREAISFVPQQFENDDETASAVNSAYIGLKGTFAELIKLFDELDSYDLQHIYIRADQGLTDLSNNVFGTWRAVSSGWNKEYQVNTPIKKKQSEEKYFEAMQKAYKKNASFSLFDVQRYGTLAVDKTNCSVTAYYSKFVTETVKRIDDSYAFASKFIEGSYSENFQKKLSSNDTACFAIKNLLDNIKELEITLKHLLGTGKEADKDDVFYGLFQPLYDKLATTKKLYDKVRNYCSQGSYSNEKIKLNFSNSLFLGGWDKNQERVYRSGIFRKNGTYYLVIMDKSNSRVFMNAPIAEDGEECYEKMEYKLLPQPNKMLPKVFFSAKYMKDNPPTENIMRIYKEGTFKKGPAFSITDCYALIDFYKEAILNHPDWSQFGFKFSDTKSYHDISDFFAEVSNQGYMINFVNVPCSYIDDCVDKGQVYMFRLYNNDFSEHSHGKPDTHTMFFQMLFDERNLADVCAKLNGKGEMFYRKPSIFESDMIVHPANQPIANKNPNSPTRTSTYAFDIIKDRRYTRRQFSIHLCLTLNFKARRGDYINNDVRLALHRSKKQNIISICRGESNLVYVMVLDDKGNILEQRSLNTICNSKGYKVDYNKLIENRVKERNEARKSWGTIEQIKDLKAGYLSQVIHEICNLIYKYDAIIVLEDLDYGVGKGNQAIDRQIFQKFESMLISKLNFLFDKNKEVDEEGGILKAYQLTNGDSGTFTGMKQNGILFFMPTWYTDNIDPTTGFVDLLRPRFSNVAEAQELFASFCDMRYNASADMFEIDIDYEKYHKGSVDHRKKWTICSNGERIRYFRNKDGQNDYERVALTAAYKELFREFGIDYKSDLKNAVLSISNKDFCYRLVRLIALTLQLKNRIIGSIKPEDNFVISPVRNENGEFFDSRDYLNQTDAPLPVDIDSNAAFNIGRKGVMLINMLQSAIPSEVTSVSIGITNADWLRYLQD